MAHPVVVPTPSSENAILSPLNGPGALIKNQSTIDVWVYTWTLNPIPVI